MFRNNDIFHYQHCRHWTITVVYIIALPVNPPGSAVVDQTPARDTHRLLLDDGGDAVDGTSVDGGRRALGLQTDLDTQRTRVRRHTSVYTRLSD